LQPCTILGELGISLLSRRLIPQDVDLEVLLLITHIVHLVDETLRDLSPCPFLIRSLTLQGCLLGRQVLDVALRDRDKAVQLREFSRSRTVNVCQAAVQVQQLRIGIGLNLGRLRSGLSLSRLIGCGRGRHDLNHATSLIQDFVALTGVLSGHALTIKHGHPATVDIAIEQDARFIVGLNGCSAAHTQNQTKTYCTKTYCAQLEHKNEIL
jgi:hypothetical protein